LLRALAAAELADAAVLAGFGGRTQAEPSRSIALEAQLRAAYPQIWAVLSERMKQGRLLSREAARRAWDGVEDAVQALSPSMVLRCIAQAGGIASFTDNSPDGHGRNR
jgi:hypothetical protein